jgi:hypothetical protein
MKHFNSQKEKHNIEGQGLPSRREKQPHTPQENN